MEQVEQPVEQEPIPTEQAEEQTQEREPIKDVGTFWERLDEVLDLVKTGGTIQNKQLEEILEQFPEYEKVSGENYKSFIFQPERIALSSNDDQTLLTAKSNSLYTSGHQYAERFSTFRINFQKALRNVKSIQLLSAVIPNATQNIPDESVCFFYYKLRSTGATAPDGAYQGEWNTLTNYIPGDIVGIAALNQNYACKTKNININPSTDNGTNWIPINLPIDPTIPNVYDLNPYHISVVYLFPTFGNLPESEPLANQNGFNRTFEDYNDLVNALNFCVSNNGNLANSSAAIANDITFQYNQTLNKIQMIPNPAQVALGYYYLPCGYADPNIEQFFTLPAVQTFFGVNLPGVFLPQTTLNLRLGYTWNGVFQDPFQSPDSLTNPELSNTLLWYLRPKNPQYPVPWTQSLLTFNSYPDLVNTASVRLYADVTLGSTEDSSNQGGLLSVVPVNTNNLGVGFYQNNFNNPLTKIPRNIPEITIRMLTDNGLPYYLPNSATVLLELAFEYY